MDLIDYYRALEEGSCKMLEAARVQDLDSVMKLEGVCAVLIEQLRFRSSQEQLAHDQRSEKARIMQRILRNDAEIRHLTEPWIPHLEEVLDGGKRVLH